MERLVDVSPAKFEKKARMAYCRGRTARLFQKNADESVFKSFSHTV